MYYMWIPNESRGADRSSTEGMHRKERDGSLPSLPEAEGMCGC
jgi:hypothetical protein